MVKYNSNTFTTTADQLDAAGFGATVSDIAEKQNRIKEAEFYGQFIREARAGGWYDEDGALAGKLAEDLALYESYATQADYEALRAELKLDVGETATADVVELAAPAGETLATATPIADGTSRRVARRGGRLITRGAATIAGLALAGCSFGSTPTPAPSVPVSAAPSPSVSPSNINTPTASPSPSPSVTPSEVPTTMTPNERDNRDTQQPQDKTKEQKEQEKKLEREARDKADAEFFGVSLKQLQEFRKDHGFGKDTKFFSNAATDAMRDGKGNKKNGMESNLAIGEELCVDEGTTAKECAAELKMAAGANRFLAPYLMSEINGQGGFRSAYENKLENKYQKDSDAWRKDVQKFIEKSKDFKWKLEKINPSNVRWTHSMSKRNPGTIAVLQYSQDGTRLVAYSKNGKEIAGVRIQCQQGTEAGHKPVVHKPSQPNKPYKPGKPNKSGKPKPPKKLEKKNQNQNLIRTNNPGSHDNSSDNANVNTNNDNKLQPREPDVDWNS